MNCCLEIKLVGGLGNQLFQYAAGRQLALQNKIPFLFFNVDGYINESLGRTFSLGQLNIKDSINHNRHFKNIFRSQTKLNRLVNKFGLFKSIAEKGFVLQSLNNKAGFFTSLNGYWQSAFYFNEIRKLLIEELVPIKLPVYPDWIKVNNTVATHVRRKDYLSENRYGFIGINYYLLAIEFIKSHVDHPLFVIFSDDIEWCRTVFTGDNYIFCDEENWKEDYLQLHLMSKCKHQIIANSSFSWWGAWLNTNVEKIVIRPMEPFKDKSLLYESHYPAEWIAIEN